MTDKIFDLESANDALRKENEELKKEFRRVLEAIEKSNPPSTEREIQEFKRLLNITTN